MGGSTVLCTVHVSGYLREVPLAKVNLLIILVRCTLCTCYVKGSFNSCGSTCILQYDIITT